MQLCWSLLCTLQLNTRDDLCIFARFSRILMSAASKVVMRTGSPLRNPRVGRGVGKPMHKTSRLGQCTKCAAALGLSADVKEEF